MTMLTDLKTALAPHGFDALQQLNLDIDTCDDSIEIIGRDGLVTEIEVQIYSGGSGTGYGINEWDGDGMVTHYSGSDARRVVAVVLELLKVSA